MVRQPSSLYKRHRFPGERISPAVWRYYRLLLRRAAGQPSPSRVKMAPAPPAGYGWARPTTIVRVTPGSTSTRRASSGR
jgi:hypothetical protein